MKDHEIRELVNGIAKAVKIACPDSPQSIREVISHQVGKCMAVLMGPRWVSVDNALPDCIYEHTEWYEGVEECSFDGMVSQSVEITDGSNWARGHYQSDGVWHMYDESQHDFLNVDPKEVTHWMTMVKLPD